MGTNEGELQSFRRSNLLTFFIRFNIIPSFFTLFSFILNTPISVKYFVLLHDLLRLNSHLILLLSSLFVHR